MITDDLPFPANAIFALWLVGIFAAMAGLFSLIAIAAWDAFWDGFK